MLVFPPSDSIEAPISTCKVSTFDELENKIQECTQSYFTGRLDLEDQTTQKLYWSLFFRLGRLIGGASQVHPIRRWYQQLVEHCPQLISNPKSGKIEQSQYWNQEALVELVKQKKITYQQLVAVIEGNLTAILFDIIQQGKQKHYPDQSLLAARPLPQEFCVSSSLLIPPPHVLQKAKCLWETWQKANLTNCSPNEAPIIWDAEALRQQTSLLAYHHLTRLANGEHTLRDIAVKLKQPLVPLAQSIQPYLQSGIMGMVEIGDLSFAPQAFSNPSPSEPDLPLPVPVTRSDSPLVAYIEDSRFDSIAMSQILTAAGYRFINVRDPVQALHILLEQKPSLIFLDLLMPVTNGYEVCAQIRRISAFKDTPVIIVTSRDGVVDRVRSKLIGASGFIAKPIVQETVLAALQNHLPISQ